MVQFLANTIQAKVYHSGIKISIGICDFIYCTKCFIVILYKKAYFLEHIRYRFCTLKTFQWQKNLTNNIKELEKAKRIIVQYEQHKNSGLYQSVMDMIVRANRETFEEVKSMCKALEELMKDELDASRNFGFEQGIERGMAQGIEQGIKSLIETCQELGASKEETLIRVKNKFSLEEENAAQSLEKYWRTEETM